MGYLFIALTVFCSLLIAHFLKLSEKSNVRLLNILAINYLTATLLSFFISENYDLAIFVIHPEILLLGAFLGVLFIGNLFVYSRSLDRVGMGISIATMRLSLVIPIAVSLILYGEDISFINSVGIFCVLISLVLMAPNATKNIQAEKRDFIFPIILFVFTGLVDTSLKVYNEELGSIFGEYQFLSVIFLFSFFIAIAILAYKKEFNFKVKEILYGFLIGLANLYSSFFLLLALDKLPGSIAFSIVNISTVLLGTFIGITIWMDKISTKQRIGLTTALISILLLII